MNIDDVERILPNGFHDSVLERVVIDYAACSAELTLGFWIDLMAPVPGKSGRHLVMRRATVSLEGLVSVAIEPPGTSVSPSGGLDVDRERREASAKQVPGLVTDECFTLSLYAADWNSSIEFVASVARLAWLETEASAWDSARGA